MLPELIISFQSFFLFLSDFSVGREISFFRKRDFIFGSETLFSYSLTALKSV